MELSGASAASSVRLVVVVFVVFCCVLCSDAMPSKIAGGHHGDLSAPELPFAKETPVEACLFACQRCYDQMREVLLDCANNLCLARGDLAEKMMLDEFWIKSCPNMAFAINAK